MAIQGWNSGEGWNDLIKAKQDEDIRKREYFEKLGSDFGGGLTKGIDEGELLQKQSLMMDAVKTGDPAVLNEFFVKYPDMLEHATTVYDAVGGEPMTVYQGKSVGIAEDQNKIAQTKNEIALREQRDKQESKKNKDKSDQAKLRRDINAKITGLTKKAESIYYSAKALGGLAKLATKDETIGGQPAMAAVYLFMRALDPGSTVMQGEYTSAEGTSGLLIKATNVYNKLAKGQTVPIKVIQDFEKTAMSISDTSRDSALREVDAYLNTYGDTLDSEFVSKLRERIPGRFTKTERGHYTAKEISTMLNYAKKYADSTNPKVRKRVNYINNILGEKND